MTDDAPKLYPSWKQALRELELANIAPGHIITKEWLEERFELTPPTTIGEAARNNQMFRTYVWQLREALLEKQKLMLRPVDGVGYRVIDPGKQTEQAMRDRGQEVARALGKLANEITHVRLDELTDEQRKANADAQAKVGALVAMAQKKLTVD